ncbi:dTDP-glucose 4,6-dehydratase [Minwuia sp.]|uniref:dTDP-glucose 4,6-dehydratase n=1 Tax=Minwuia sp. TaxID=2493630 RepID=UPI003A8E4786
MKIIVTGGCGFIGSALVRRLVGDGHQVLNVDALTYAGLPENVASVADSADYAFLEADVCDVAPVAAAMKQFRPDAVMHLAAESHVDRSIDGPADFIRTNVTGTGAMLEAALAYWRNIRPEAQQAFRFLHVSTDEVYGSLPDGGYFTENDPYRPNSPYAASKAGSDHLVRAFGATYGLPVLITNCGNNYGPYQFPEKLIPVIVMNAVAGRPLPVYGDGANVRDWIHVDDHVAALLRVLESGTPGETYLVGARGERRNLDLVKTICARMDRVEGARFTPHEKLITFVTDRPGHDQRYAIDPTKIETELGWKPAISFEDGMDQTIRWYLDNRDWIDTVHDRRRLGEG